MKGLLLKDWYNLKQYVMVMALFFVIGCINESFSYMLVVLGVMMVATSFYYDNYSKWDKFARSMPLSLEMLVGSKYLLMLINAAGAFVAALAAQYIHSLLSQTPFGGSMQTLLGFLFGSLLFGSLLLPIVIKFGPEKMRYMMIVICALGGIAIGGVFALAEGELPSLSLSINFVLFVLLPLAAAIALVVSYMVSLRIYQKKEF